MNIKDTMDSSYNGDVEPILPDGWKEGDDIFADAENTGETLSLDGVEELSGSELGALTEDGDPAEVPTTDGEGDPEVPSAEETPEPAAPDGAEPTPVVSSRILQLKVNHGAPESFDVNAASDEDLVAMLQKARAFDAMKDEQMKAKYRQVYADQLESGMTEAVASLVAANAAGGKVYSLEDEEETPAPAADPQPAVPTRDFDREFQQLHALYPEMTQLPNEVMSAYLKGADLLSAYSAYRVAKSEQAVASVKKENTILRQNAAAAARAPVKGVTGGGNTVEREKDDFEKGFDSDPW